jgi:hypothetical protein
LLHLTHSFPLDYALLDSDELENKVLAFAAASFALIVESGILELAPQAIEDEEEGVAD